MDHLAEKVNGTAHFFERVSDIAAVPKKGMMKFRANPDLYVRRSLLLLGSLAIINVLVRDYTIVSPFSTDF